MDYELLKKWNALNSTVIEAGGTLPVLVNMKCDKRVGGAKVTNLSEGQRFAAGSPFYFDVSTHEAKFLRLWKIKAVTPGETTTLIEIYKNRTTPALVAGTPIMVVPSTISGTGKAVACPTVSVNASGNYEITVTTADVDALAADAFLAEAAEAGSAKALACQPNNISIEDVCYGNVISMVDVPYGIIYMYSNTIPFMPDVVKTAVSAGDVKIVWELFSTES